jgi:hypothetical protein
MVWASAIRGVYCFFNSLFMCCIAVGSDMTHVVSVAGSHGALGIPNQKRPLCLFVPRLLHLRWQWYGVKHADVSAPLTSSASSCCVFLLSQARMALGIPNQKRPLARQIGVLFWRGLLDMLRNPLLTAFHALGGLLLGLLVGIIFFSGKQLCLV